MTKTYALILKRMKENYVKLAGYEADDASDIGIRLKVLAGEVFSLQTALDWLERQTFVQTAQGHALDLRAQERGIVRKGAQKACGMLDFMRNEPLWYNAHIEKGTVCATAGEDGVRYVTTQEAILPVNQLKVSVPAVAEQGGRAGNAAAGAVTVMITPPPGIQSVKNITPFIGGEDEEGDEELRARTIKSFETLSNGSNAAFYRECALRHSGIYSAAVVPRENGVGTVSLYLGARGDVPSSDVVHEVQNELNKLRELNVTVTAAAAKKVAVDGKILLVLPDGGSFAEAEAAVRKAVTEYFCSLGVGEPFVAAVLMNRVFSTGQLKNCTLENMPDRRVNRDQLVVEGTIKIEKNGGM